jgi:hypothetical protein
VVFYAVDVEGGLFLAEELAEFVFFGAGVAGDLFIVFFG